MRHKNVDWIEVAQDRVQGRAFLNTGLELISFLSGGVGGCYILKRQSSSRNVNSLCPPSQPPIISVLLRV